MDPLIAALLATPVGPTTAPASQPTAGASANAGGSAQFQAQFAQAVAILTHSAGTNANGSSVTAASTSSGSASANVSSLQAALQKKITALLNAGESLTQIVQQLASSLATQFAQQFGGDVAAITSQLQSVFTQALAPTGNGPPGISNADIASALAQRFTQIVNLAAGVLGETGQSNRLFAGSISDAATTAGVQPAPDSTTGTGPSSADSNVSSASALQTALTANQPPSGGPTVATTAALIGSNGDTLLGRILTRAANASTTASAAPSTAPTTPTTTASPLLASAGSRAVSALAAAVAALGPSPASNASTTPSAAPQNDRAAPAAPSPQLESLPSANVLAAFTSKAAPSIVADSASTNAAATGANATTSSAAESTALPAAVQSFVKTFSAALASADAPVNEPKPVTDDGVANQLPSSVSSLNAPTLGLMAPVGAAVQNDAAGASGSQSPTPSSAPSPSYDVNNIVDQVLQGAFLNTVGSTSTVRLKLVPESLGDVSVKLAIVGDTVSANIIAQTPAAHDALVAGQSQLTRSLADAGLKLTGFNVDLSNGGSSGFSQQQQQQQQSTQAQSNGAACSLAGSIPPRPTRAACWPSLRSLRRKRRVRAGARSTISCRSIHGGYEPNLWIEHTTPHRQPHQKRNDRHGYDVEQFDA